MYMYCKMKCSDVIYCYQNISPSRYILCCVNVCTVRYVNLCLQRQVKKLYRRDLKSVPSTYIACKVGTRHFVISSDE